MEGKGVLPKSPRPHAHSSGPGSEPRIRHQPNVEDGDELPDEKRVPQDAEEGGSKQCVRATSTMTAVLEIEPVLPMAQLEEPSVGGIWRSSSWSKGMALGWKIDTTMAAMTQSAMRIERRRASGTGDTDTDRARVRAPQEVPPSCRLSRCFCRRICQCRCPFQE